MAKTESFECVAGGPTTHKFPIDRNLNQILIKRTSNVSLMAGLDVAVPERIKGTVRRHNGSTEEFFREEPRLAHVLHYSQFTSGPLIEQYIVAASGAANGAALGLSKDFLGLDLSAATLVRPYVAWLLIDLTKPELELMGLKLGLEVTSDDDASVTLEGMLPGALYEFYCQETPVTGTNKLVFTSVNILAGKKRNAIDVDHMAAVVLPATGSIQSVKIQYNIAGSDPVEKTIEDLKYENAQHNLLDIMQLKQTADGKTVGTLTVTPLSADLVVLMLNNVVSVEINTDGTLIEYTQVVEKERGTTAIE